MNKRFEPSAVKTVRCPDEYPTRMILRKFTPASSVARDALNEATCLECQYEILTKEIKAGGSVLLEKGEKLVEIEQALNSNYYILASCFSGDDTQRKKLVAEMLTDTDLLARRRANEAGRQR